MDKKANILFAEDDINLRFVTQDNLESHGFQVSSFEDGQAAWQAFQQGGFDLCLLDVMLPDMDGFTLASHIRSIDHNIPILFLTARSLKEDRINGFRMGGDDYITKPFSIDELIMRIEVFLRRSGIAPVEKIDEKRFFLGQYNLDFTNLKLQAPDSTVYTLTLREAELLRYLSQHPNQLLKREDILTQVWGNDDYFAGRSLDVFISRLRKYLSKDEKLAIENVHGVGFRMEVKA